MNYKIVYVNVLNLFIIELILNLYKICIFNILKYCRGEFSNIDMHVISAHYRSYNI